MYDLGGDPFGGGGAAASAQGAGLLVHRHHGRLLRRPGRRRRRQGRGPRPRTRRGQDALIRLEVDLAEAAFGVTRELKVDTAVLCTTCHGDGRRAGHAPDAPARPAAVAARSRTCSARSSARSAPCGRAPPAAASARSSPSRAASAPATAGSASRRTLTVKIPAGVDTGTRVQLAGAGRGRPGRRPRRRPVRRDRTSTPHPVFTRARRRPALHGHGADDGGRARHHDRRCRRSRPTSAERRTPTSRRSVAARDPARHPVRHRDTCCAAAACPSLRGTGRGDLVVTDRRRDADAARRRARRSCCASSPRCATRSARRAASHAPHKSVFDRLRDAFNPR